MAKRVITYSEIIPLLINLRNTVDTIRKVHNFTYEDIAYETELNTATVYRFLQGKTQAREKTIISIVMWLSNFEYVSTVLRPVNPPNQQHPAITVR